MGIFDEAFKSRIQLNLRYENLGKEQRLQIWENFIDRLEALHMQDNGDTVAFELDVGDIRDHVDSLAQPNLNGREIRNIISIARQLATYKHQPLGYSHLQRVIVEAERFDLYLTGVRKGFSADQVQEHKGER